MSIEALSVRTKNYSNTCAVLPPTSSTTEYIVKGVCRMRIRKVTWSYVPSTFRDDTRGHRVYGFVTRYDFDYYSHVTVEVVVRNRMYSDTRFYFDLGTAWLARDSCQIKLPHPSQ